jgi:xanthine dehydrogenase YagT iron-sulfur-binding subunit
VLLDGRAVYACLTITHACDGASVTTIEGLAGADGLHPVQRAFIEHDAVQCGFCTPGQVMAAVALLAEHPVPDEPTIRRAMSGNLCRCGTYPRILAAIQAVAAQGTVADAR